MGALISTSSSTTLLGCCEAAVETGCPELEPPASKRRLIADSRFPSARVKYCAAIASPSPVDDEYTSRNTMSRINVHDS